MCYVEDGASKGDITHCPPLTTFLYCMYSMCSTCEEEGDAMTTRTIPDMVRLDLRFPFKRDMGREHNWTLRKHNLRVVPGPAIFSLDQVAWKEDREGPYPFNDSDKKQGNQFHAEQWIASPGFIPDAWQDWNLLFPETIWGDQENRSYYPVLHWSRRSKMWDLYFQDETVLRNCLNLRMVLVER